MLSKEDWKRIFTVYWKSPEDFCGQIIVKDGEVKGFLGLIFSSRTIDGEMQKFCNLNSWIVDDDCRSSPTSDAVVLVSEGAHEVGGAALERGEADAFGHRKLGGIGARVGAMLQGRLGRGIISQSLGYLVRSGPPDWVDVQAGLALAHAALECIDAGTSGVLVVVRGGRRVARVMELTGADRQLEMVDDPAEIT